ncbi:tumor necrosis factor receptor superfamily member 25 [Cheilinus undulatus]|uniref:tumor necrosis factor receptor superfamily member 25 n=1 Tax=Cheilinus undulatus TaxID=241271 RepID=UPI001BD36C41|nr:tumor necrosis factor receptor superfamily member 25 [Cheilinus undulatus]
MICRLFSKRMKVTLQNLPNFRVVYSVSMDLVLLLILTFLSNGPCYALRMEQAGDFCDYNCPHGYYRNGVCADKGKYRCNKCEDGEYTDRENLLECHRCSQCRHKEVEIKPCSDISDRICDCPERHYYLGDPDFGICQPCPDDPCNKSPRHKDCRRKCQRNTTTNSPVPTARSTITATLTTIRNTPEMNRISPHWNQMAWLFLVGFTVVIFLVLSWLLFFIKPPLKCPGSCPCWSPNKDLEQPVQDSKCNEQHSHQGSSPTTVTVNITEETSMITLNESQSTREHPTAAYKIPLLPDTEHKADRQGNYSGHWPAIVLYAIINEVPLRRWKEFLRLLSVADQQLERVELEAGLGLGSIEKQYQMLRLWSQRSTANLNDVFLALHYMDLSGCAQLLQERLDKLKWRSEMKEGVTTGRNYTGNGFSGVVQET